MKQLNLLRNAALFLTCLTAIAPVRAATRVTIAQLEQFLTSRQAMKESDEQIAERLNQAELSEELVGPALARILAETSSWPRTAEQIEVLAAESIFEAAPSADQHQDPAPDSATLQRMIDQARAYANGALHLLPDLLAVRVTRSFANTIIDFKPKHGKPKAQMHFVREYRREMAYRNGHEINSTIGRSSDPGVEQTSGLSTWGEFGGILKIVFNDAFGGHVAWERWQRNGAGERMAVFHYAIPESSSHYKVDFCCYLLSKENPVEMPFKAQPGYHGELFVDPRRGTIDRITLEADMKETDAVRRSAIAVQYGRVEIGGKWFVCPVRSVAITDSHNVMMEEIDGVGLEKHINLVEFVGYRKFGSTSRILPGVMEK
jgi:hypothetical protein